MLRFVLDDHPAFARRLRGLGWAAAEGLRPALAELGVETVQAARELAPRRSGRLRDSIEIRTAGDANAVDVSAAAPYAAFVEFGTLRRPPRPFLVPALALARRRLDVLARALVGVWR